MSSLGASDLDPHEAFSYLPPRNEIEPIGALSRVDPRLANEHYRETSPFSFDPPRLFDMPRRAETVTSFLAKFDERGCPKEDLGLDIKTQFQTLITAHPSDSQLRKKYAGYLSYVYNTTGPSHGETIARLAHLARNELLFSSVYRDDGTFFDQVCKELNHKIKDHPFEKINLDHIYAINQAHLTKLSLEEVMGYYKKILTPVKDLLEFREEGLKAEDMEGFFDAFLYNLIILTPPHLQEGVKDYLFDPKGEYAGFVPLTPLTQSCIAKRHVARHEYSLAIKVYQTYLPRFINNENDPLGVDAHGLRAYHMFPYMALDYSNRAYVYYAQGLYDLSYQSSWLAMQYSQVLVPRYLNAMALVALERYREAKILLRGLKALPRDDFKPYPDMYSIIKASYEHVLTALDAESELQGLREWKEHMSQRQHKILSRLQQKMKEKLASTNALSDEEARKKADAVAAMLLQEEKTETQSHRKKGGAKSRKKKGGAHASAPKSKKSSPSGASSLLTVIPREEKVPQEVTGVKSPGAAAPNAQPKKQEALQLKNPQKAPTTPNLSTKKKQTSTTTMTTLREKSPSKGAVATPTTPPSTVPIEELITGTPYKIFCTLFEPFEGNKRKTSLKVSLSDVETLMKALKQVYKKNGGKGSHEKANLDFVTESGEMRKKVLILARHTYLKPYQITDLCMSFISYGFYPHYLKDRLQEKGHLPGADR
ncbi:MAG: hypothetical protein ACK50V_05630 [Alphaproteobacteria bacterium]